MRIVFTGGGTGGHITPVVSVVRELKRIYPHEHISPLELFLMGPKGAFEEKALLDEGVQIEYILGAKLRRYISLSNLVDIVKLPIGFLQALWQLYKVMPDIVWAKGGFGSLSIGFVAWLYRIPLIIHESDTIPGLSNRFLSIFATEIGVCFEQALRYFPPQKTALVGNPIRRSLFEGDPNEARSYFTLSGEEGRPIIMVMGGSQGAQRLNTLIAESLHDLLPSYELIHQCGATNYDEFVTELRDVHGIDPEKNPYYHVRGYLEEHEQAMAYSVVDLFISRAGAGTIFEIAALGKPSILIPLPHAASEHQTRNAYHFARRGASVVLQQHNLTPHLLLNEIHHILKNPLLAKQMSVRAKEIAKPDASLIIATNLVELAIKKQIVPPWLTGESSSEHHEDQHQTTTKNEKRFWKIAKKK